MKYFKTYKEDGREGWEGKGRGEWRGEGDGERDSGAEERGRRGRKRWERTEKENGRKSWRKGDGGEVIYMKRSRGEEEGEKSGKEL